MRNWQVLIIPAIALVVWILTSLFRRDEPPPPPRRRPERFDEPPKQQRRPLTKGDRTYEEARRRREEAVRRADFPPPVVLEEVIKPQRRDKTRSAPRSPVVLELAEPVVVLAPVQEAPAVKPALASSKAPSTKPPIPAVAPSLLPAVPTLASSAKPEAALSPLAQVRQLLRSPQSAATAFVLREILDAPRCRRPR